MATAELAASSGPCWADINIDLLSEISHHLHDAADYIRFHAVCKSWRASLRPPACRPALLPWLLGVPNVRTGYRKVYYIFSSASKSTARRAWKVQNRGWALAPDDGVAAYRLLPAGDHDEPDDGGPLRPASSVALPPYPDEMQSWPVDSVSGMVSGDGTVFLCAFRILYQIWTPPVHISMAFMRPGDATWTLRESIIDTQARSPLVENCSVAYHDGQIVQCWTEANSFRNCWTIESANSVPTTRFQGSIRESLQRSRGRSYLLESRGELLWVLVLWTNVLSRRCNDDNSRYNDSHLAGSVAVSVYALRHEQGGAPQWVRRNDGGRSLADRALFLAWQGSFAVDVARLGNTVDGGCAYFVHHALGKHVFKYSFIEDRVDIVEDLQPSLVLYDFHYKWIMPNQPTIATTEEIQEKLRQTSIGNRGKA